jgi:ADP-ribosylarginine hydrolase
MNKNEKIEASIMLASYLDTLGYYNSKWEFNYNVPSYKLNDALVTMQNIVFNYYIMGGPSKINISEWNASDDTILLLATCNAVNKGGGELNYINEYINIFELLNDGKRAPGFQTIESLKHLKKITKTKKISYLSDIPIKVSMGGNGAAIRTSCIGIKWHNDIDKIIEESITASRITHNFPLGFLGGLVSALFTSYAFNNIKPWLWIDNLLELHETNKIKEYIYTTNLENKFDEEIDDYFLYWYKYKEDRFRSVMGSRYNKSVYNNLNELSEFMPKFKIAIKKNDVTFNNLGLSGIDSVIYSYDALLLSIVPKGPHLSVDLNNFEYSWESIMFFGSLHVGDSDSTGAILGSWFGALNGYHEINKNNIKQLEFYSDLKNAAKKLFY